VTVIWAEFATSVAPAFAAGPASRDLILAYATASHARPELIDLLCRLPNRAFPDVDDLWRELSRTIDGG
jgi:hypothetical protein